MTAGAAPAERERRHAGGAAPALTTAAAMALIWIGELDDLAIVAVMLLLIVFALVNAVLVKKERVEHDHIETPRIFPVFGILVSTVLFVKRVT